MSIDQAPEDVTSDLPVYSEYGTTGLKRWAGEIDEEFLPQLKGRKAVKVYTEMRDNDPIIGGLLFAIDMIMRQVTWRVEPASSLPEDQYYARFVEECMKDMSHTWEDMVSEILSMLVYGWSWHEVVYKRRLGDVRNPAFRSNHRDGMIGWRKIPLRAQETWHKWEFSEDGGLRAMEQLAPPDYKTRRIPMKKSLLFRTRKHKDNPEGRSVLRNAYRPYYFKKRFEEIEAIGADRDLAGMPKGYVPAEFMRPNATAEQKAVVNEMRRVLRNTRRDTQEGLLIPNAWDTDTGNRLYEIELMTTGGTRQFDTDKIITRYEQRIAMTVLADFILLGNENQGRGSYALSTTKSGLFRTALNSWCQSIAEIFNRHELPRLFRLNGWDLRKMPELIPGQVDPPDLEELGNLINKTAGAGMQWFPDPDLENFVRDAAKLPPREPEKYPTYVETHADIPSGVDGMEFFGGPNQTGEVEQQPRQNRSEDMVEGNPDQ